VTPRVTAALEVSALIRRVNAAGGFATILHKGDETAGSLLLLLTEKGRISAIYERALTIGDCYDWRELSIQDFDNEGLITDIVDRRRNIDPDLWVVELDIAHPERFIVG
jgi:hypothetical protein